MSNIIDQAQKIIEANGFKDSTLPRSSWFLLYSPSYLLHLLAITLVKGKLEEAELPIQQFDIIISEWMGASEAMRYEFKSRNNEHIPL